MKILCHVIGEMGTVMLSKVADADVQDRMLEMSQESRFNELVDQVEAMADHVQDVLAAEIPEDAEFGIVLLGLLQSCVWHMQRYITHATGEAFSLADDDGDGTEVTMQEFETHIHEEPTDTIINNVVSLSGGVLLKGRKIRGDH